MGSLRDRERANAILETIESLVADTNSSIVNELKDCISKVIPLRKSSKQHLNDVCQDLNVPLTDQIIKTGNPATAILNTLKDIDADLLVIGSYGQSGFFKRLGSVAQKIISQIDRDILIIK